MKSRAAKFDLLDLCSQGELIVGTAAVVVAVWVYTKPIVFSYDSFTYLEHARELKLGKWADALYPRLPIFPAILWAFRVTDTTHSVFWLIIFQSCLAVASCWLFYVTARLVYPRGAFVLSLVFIASLLPFVQVKHIMTEQTFFFETMLTLYGLVAYLMARTNRETLSAAIALAVGAALMTLTRPQGSYVAPVLFGLVAALVWRRAWIALVGAVLVICAVWSAQVIDQRIRSGDQNRAGNFDNSHTTGAMLFFTFYLDGVRAHIHISPENGPRTAELKALLLDELAQPDTLARRRGYLTSVTPREVPAYVEKSFAEPDSDFWSLLGFTALKERLGPRPS